jgi:hypothetical protein
LLYQLSYIGLPASFYRLCPHRAKSVDAFVATQSESVLKGRYFSFEGARLQPRHFSKE